MVETYRNAIARSKAAKRSFVADELADECDDFGGLTFRVPMERVRSATLPPVLYLACSAAVPRRMYEWVEFELTLVLLCRES